MESLDALALESVAQSFDFGLLDEQLADDLERSLLAGISANAVFETKGGPEELFIAAIARAIRAIEAKDRAGLLEEFLKNGPYPDSDLRPGFVPEDFMSDDRVAAAIRFIHSSSINSFQGALAEILAVGPICRIAECAYGADAPRVFVGDTVLARKPARGTWAKAADFHLLAQARKGGGARAELFGVAEVKSFTTTLEELEPQLSQHLRRASRGLRILDAEISGHLVQLGKAGEQPVRIAVTPANWTLSRKVQFDNKDGRTFLAQIPVAPPQDEDQVVDLGEGRWLVTLRWSQEALASLAYTMTFWYMGELGRTLFESRMPRCAEEMTPAEAGLNAAKQSLYYAILRARSIREQSRAIALYNAYGFGYSLGANFVDKNGRRCELFFDDLKEIEVTGRSRTQPIEVVKDGKLERVIPASFCRIR